MTTADEGDRAHRRTPTDTPVRDPRFDVLFEPVQIGPKTARNRFFQVPHCNGMGHRHPAALAAMRGVKAEGGWAVVCTEEVEIHHTSALDPFVEGRLWDDADIPAHELMVQAVHEHGALAGIELAHNGSAAGNHVTRVAPMAPSVRPVSEGGTGQARAMRLEDIAALRRWHRAAVRRSLDAGYDLVYVYAGHALSVVQEFLSSRSNHRTDAYGGSLVNRARLLRELLEDTRELCEGRAAVACRLVVDELRGPTGLQRTEVEELFGLIGELPDLWDLMVGEWDFDSSTSRFESEGYQEPFVAGFRDLTTKPIVIVGRYTSPDSMARVIRSGLSDFIGAARPSIADPFLPAKIEQGRPEDIRECIGCNVCVTSDWIHVPIRCTQNAAMGEEWRRGWHPERIAPRRSSSRILVVGAGPAGLEAASWLGHRGYEVVLAEATRTLGGRVDAEARLPGLSAWRRVIEYRVGQLEQLDQVLVARESPMTAEEIAGYEFDHVAVATGASWRDDGVGHFHTSPAFAGAVSPDRVLAGEVELGERVVVFDDEHNYLGGVLAERLASAGAQVTLVTPEARVSAWTVNTMEQSRIHRRLLDVGVQILTNTSVLAWTPGSATVVDVYSEEESDLQADALVPVTMRMPSDGLVLALNELGIPAVTAIGDAWNPGTIADAVHHGRMFAEEFAATVIDPDATPFRRELIALEPREAQAPRR